MTVAHVRADIANSDSVWQLHGDGSWCRRALTLGGQLLAGKYTVAAFARSLLGANHCVRAKKQGVCQV